VGDNPTGVDLFTLTNEGEINLCWLFKTDFFKFMNSINTSISSPSNINHKETRINKSYYENPDEHIFYNLITSNNFHLFIWKP